MDKNEIMEHIGPYIMEMMQNEKQQKREQFRRLNQYVREGQIVFAGSSLMEQFPVNPEAAEAPHMQEMLKIRTNERIRHANDEVKKLAEKNGYQFINVSQGIQDKNGCLRAEFSKDGMHFYADGYEAIFQELIKFIEE